MDGVGQILTLLYNEDKRMTSENVKDIRLMIELISKDYQRLAADMKTLSEFLLPLQKEKENVEQQ